MSSIYQSKWFIFDKLAWSLDVARRDPEIPFSELKNPRGFGIRLISSNLFRPI